VLNLGSTHISNSITPQLNADENLVWESSPAAPIINEANSLGWLITLGLLFLCMVLFRWLWALPAGLLLFIFLQPKRLQQSNWCYLTNVRFIVIDSSSSGRPKVVSIPFDQILNIVKTKSGVIVRPMMRYMLTPGGFSEDISIQLPPEGVKALLERIPDTVPRSG
jgi:hypothetical protein